MKNIYYRVISNYIGNETLFIPKHTYEQGKVINGIYTECANIANKVKQGCFAKTVEGCLFGINMFLKEGTYYIYKTNQIPTID